MSGHRWLGAALFAALACAGNARYTERIVGSPLRVDRSGESEVRGELLAVQQDSLWVLPKGANVQVVAIADITRVRVPREGLTSGGVVKWTLIGGAASGLAMTVACSSAEGDCGGVFPAVMLAWGVVGGLSAAVAGSGWRSVGLTTDSLRPYARFPQGLPPGFTVQSDRGPNH